MKKHIKEEISGLSSSIKNEGLSATFHKYIFRYQMILKFLISGGTAALTLLILLFVLTEFLGVWYLLSSVLAFLIATLISFSLHKFWTFRDKGRIKFKRQIISYFVLQSLFLAVNTISIYILVDVLGLWYLVAQFFVSLTLAVISFVFYRFKIFTQSNYQTILQPLEENGN